MSVRQLLIVVATVLIAGIITAGVYDATAVVVVLGFILACLLGILLRDLALPGARPTISLDQAATWASRTAVLLVLLLGALVVIKPAVQHWNDVFDENPFQPKTTTVTLTKTSPSGKVTTTKTDKEASRSLVERSFTGGGLLLLRVGVVVLAAFLAGAIAQRTVLGDFAIKIGPVEIGALSTAATEKTASEIASVRSELLGLNEALAKNVSKTETVATATASAAEHLIRVQTNTTEETAAQIALVREELLRLNRETEHNREMATSVAEAVANALESIVGRLASLEERGT